MHTRSLESDVATLIDVKRSEAGGVKARPEAERETHYTRVHVPFVIEMMRATGRLSSARSCRSRSGRRLASPSPSPTGSVRRERARPLDDEPRVSR